MAGANPSAQVLHAVWRLLGEGAGDDEIADRLGHDAATSMSAGTAVRLLRRAAEAAGVSAPARGRSPLDEPSRRAQGADATASGSTRWCATPFRAAAARGSSTTTSPAARAAARPRAAAPATSASVGAATSGRALDDAELLSVRIALSGVGRLSGRFGVERIAQVLTGSRGREILDRGLDRIPTYGKLAGVAVDEVKDLLNVLADAGLVERQGIEGGRPGAFVLALTADGRRVARGESRPELALPAGPRARASSGRRTSRAAGRGRRERRRRRRSVRSSPPS